MTFDPANPQEGVFEDLDAATYHSAKAVSKSLLWEFHEAATPLHFKNRKKKEATADMEFGTVAHCASLQPELLHLAYYLRPETYEAEVKGKKVSKPWTGKANACQEWLEQHQDRPVMTQDQLNKLPKIRERMLALPEFGSALKTGQTEVSFFKRDEETGLMLKCRCDCVANTANGDTWIFDPKKVQAGDANERDFGESCATYGYHIQMMSYLSITGASKFVFVPFDDSEPFDACQFELDQDAQNMGYQEWRRLLLAYAKCVKEDSWPGYGSGVRKIALPKWANS
jgi:exodeoxyribonuclease VIII